jgi:pimeloyl-ACP methyl ester carboxylesterase
MIMVEEEVLFESNSVKLAGTIARPDSGTSPPGLLLLPGSGPVDRNENHKRMRLNVLQDIAVYLANNGIASLRYDKRGVGASGGDYWKTGFHNNVLDAKAALEFLRAQAGIQRENIFLLGHSEGALISTRMAGDGVDVAGVILLAGSAQSGEAILKWQAKTISKGLKGINKWLITLLRLDIEKSQQKQLSKIRSSAKDWYRTQLISKLNAKWMREFIDYNPGEDLPKIKVPVLAITGSKDIQVNPDNLKIMEELVQSPFEYHLLEGVTHILRYQEGDAGISTYKKQIKRPVDPRILSLISLWLQKQLKKQ